MATQQLDQQLRPVLGRLDRLRLYRRLTVHWLAAAAIAGLVWWSTPAAPAGLALLIGGAAAVGAMGLWLALGSRPSPPVEAARRIERTFPELDARLLTALEQSPDVLTGRLNVLQQRVVWEATCHGRAFPWVTAVPTAQMWRNGLLQTVALAVMLLALVGLSRQPPPPPGAAPSAIAQLLGAPAFPIEVEPGTAEVERGAPVLVLARFPKQVPGEVTLVWTPEGGQPERIPLQKSLDDPVFGGRLANLQTGGSYLVEYDGHLSNHFALTTYELPAVEQSEIVVQAPDYVAGADRVLPEAFDVTAVQGSKVTIRVKVNKPLSSARLVAKDGSALALQPVEGDLLGWQATIESAEPGRRLWQLELKDDKDRLNRDPEEFRVEFLPNRPPELKLAFPGRDSRLSPLEELAVAGTLLDDFGLLEYGLVVAVAGREAQPLKLGDAVEGEVSVKLEHLQAMEDLQVQPDDLISYHLYADDFGPDGQRRRTLGDMFFAEIRPLEETFREGEQQPGGGAQAAGGSGQQQQEMEQLVELQKQIIAGTWNLIRGAKVPLSPENREAAEILTESQHQALEKAEAMAEKLRNPKLAPIAEAIIERMTAAEKLLQTIPEKGREGLMTALPVEQSAYQNLLRLKAREHEIQQGQQSGTGSSSGSASASQQQLSQLELSNKQNRYEQKRQAGEQPQTVNQEQLQILDRLKELARRQQDLTDKLKELEAELRTAATTKEQDDIDRQLKRLREEQQQMLQDADELRNRMNRSSQQDELAETRQQLDETRKNLLQATEALKEGQLSQAINSGTRAARELQEMQDEFRRRTSTQFAEALRELRQQARELAEREQQLGQQIDDLQNQPRQSLRQSNDRQTLQREFVDQKQQLEQLVESARQLVQEAENAEPLASKQLYDSLRKAREQKTDQALDLTNRLLQQGFLPEAAQSEAQAREGIDQLRTGIEEAAESVLGDDVEALKRARRELAELSSELQQELAAQQGGAAGEGQGRGDKPGAQSADGQSPRAQPGQDGQPDGKAQPGQQPGEVQRPGQEPGKSEQPGQGGQPGQQPGEGQGQQPGKGEGPGQQPGQQPGQDQGQGQGQGQGQQPGRGQGGLRGGMPQSPSGRQASSQSSQGGNSGGPGGQGGPISAGGYGEWNERLRDVEAMVDDPQLQAEVTKVREQARSLRAESKRHSKDPNWDLVKTSVYEPLVELQQKLGEEISRRESGKESLAPVDRDPVPTRYRDLVKSYYERLGSGKE